MKGRERKRMRMRERRGNRERERERKKEWGAKREWREEMGDTERYI